LVEQHEPRLQNQRAGNRKAVLVAAGQLAGIAILVPRQAHETEHLLHALLDLGGRTSLQRQTECHVVEHRQMRKQRIVLEDHAEAALLGQDVIDALIVVPDLAFGRRNEASDDSERRRLAATTGAEEGDKFASAYFKRKSVENSLAAVTLGNRYTQCVDGIGHVSPPPSRDRGERSWVVTS